MSTESSIHASSKEKLASGSPLLSKPASELDRAPLSFAQQRLWFLDQLDPGTAVYNIPLGVRITGPLEVQVLRAAIDELIVRHEALRTNFLFENGVPVQSVGQPRPIELLVMDLSDRSEGRQPSELQERITREAQRPFDLLRDPLFRATLFRLNEEKHVLLFSLHHIVCDEWSLPVLFRELGALYEAFSKRETSPLAELPVQYADYAVWQRDWLQGPVLARELGYWRCQLQGEARWLTLPSDHPRGTKQSHAGRRLSVDLSAGLVRALKDLSRREGVTLFMTLLAGFKVLLARYTAQDEITVGSPIAGRPRVETEGLIGFFVNTLVLRTDLSGDPSFREVLRRVRQTALGAFDHQDLPFDKLVEELHPERSASRTPFVQVMFTLQHALDSHLKLASLDLELMEVDTGTAKFDLTWVVRENKDGINICVEYATALFQEETVSRMLGHWTVLLESIAADPDQALSRIPLMPAEERERILVTWNQTQRSYPADKTIPALFEEQVKRTPDALAVRYGSEELSYKDLDQQANQLAHLLRSVGVGPEVFVALCVERSCDLIVGMLGILKAGGAYVPLDPADPRERLQLILEDTRAPVLVTQDALRPALPLEGVKVISLGSVHGFSTSAMPAAFGPENLAYVIYTSGSTGRPKGVLVSQRAVARLVCNTDYVQLTPQDRVAQVSNVAFDAATFEIWGALLNGAALIGIARNVSLSPADLGNQLARDGVTTLFLTTALFNLVAAEAPAAFRSLTHLLFGGEAVDPKRVRQVLEGGPPGRLLHVYGPTEATTFATWYPATHVPPAAVTVPIGRPIANTQIYLLDRCLQPVPAGVTGEIYVGGPGVARGYLNQPELTAARFVPDPFGKQPGAKLYQTGDLARYRPDGNIEFIGRRDQQVKVRGFRVELGEIEAALVAHPAVRESVVVARDADTSVGKRLAAFVVLKDGYERSSVSQVRQYLRDKLPACMVPSSIIALPNLPLNANGKIDHQALPATDLDRSAIDQNFIPPRNPTEEALVALWSEVLGVSGVGVCDSFFDLGGHSLLAVRLFAEIERKFGKKLPLASLFQSPTVEQLADLIRREDKGLHPPLLVEIQAPGSRPPFFWVHSLGGDGGGAFFYYRKLAELLGPDQPSYGIRSPQEPFTRIEEMAACYVEELLRFQPEGPYFLGGFCFGGIVAFEMASQLRRQGREVGLLVLLESAAPGHKQQKLSFRLQAATTLASNLQNWLSDVVRQSPREILRRVKRRARSVQTRLRRLFESSPEVPRLGEFIDMAHYPKDYVRYAQAHWQALLAYRPRSYPGAVTLFRARKQPLLALDPTLGWGQFAEYGVAVNIIPGTHERMLEEPNVQILAAELKTCLIEAQSDPNDIIGPDMNPEAPQSRSEAAASSSCLVIT